MCCSANCTRYLLRGKPGIVDEFRKKRRNSTQSPLCSPCRYYINNTQAGVTLIELVIVMAIVGLIVGITYPSVAAGLETVRLASAADTVASFINSALNRAERRQEVIAMGISLKDNTIALHSLEPGFERKLELPDGITIQSVLPALPDADTQAPRQVILMPGGTAPRVGIVIANRKGSRRMVRLDPITGIPRIEIPDEKEP